MLVLTRKVDEALVIHTPAGLMRIKVCQIRPDQCKIGIEAPRAVKVYREELLRPRTLERSGGEPIDGMLEVGE